MLAPTGMSSEYEMTIPRKKHIVETIPEQITTPLKLEKSLIAVSDGKTIRLDMRRDPIIRMPTTMVTAVRIAMRVL